MWEKNKCLIVTKPEKEESNCNALNNTRKPIIMTLFLRLLFQEPQVARLLTYRVIIIIPPVKTNKIIKLNHGFNVMDIITAAPKDSITKK